MTSIASLERLDRLARRAPRAAHRLDRVPEPAGAEAELEPAAGEQVEARRGARQHGRRPQREVEHVAGQPDALGLRGDPGQQRPGVEERRLVRVVLERDQVEPACSVSCASATTSLRTLVLRRDERAELELVSVVGHVGCLLFDGIALVGHRRSWMLVCQGVIMLGLWLMAASDPTRSLGIIAAFAVLVGLASATQDIAIDAWRIEAAEVLKQGAMAAAYQWGYRVAIITAGAVPLLLADSYGWNVSYAVMAVLMTVGIVAVLAAPREQQHTIRPIETAGIAPAPARETLEWVVRLAILGFAALVLGSGLAANAGVFANVLRGIGAAGAADAVLALWASDARVFVQVGAVIVGLGLIALVALPLPGARTRPGVYLSSALVDPLRDFFSRYQSAAGLILALICLYRIPDFVLNIMNPFYLDLGYTLTEIAEVRKIFGVFMTMFGVFAGGLAVARYGLLAGDGHRRARRPGEQPAVHLARLPGPQPDCALCRDRPRQRRRGLRGHVPHRVHVEPHVGGLHGHAIRALLVAVRDSGPADRVAIRPHRRRHGPRGGHGGHADRDQEPHRHVRA